MIPKNLLNICMKAELKRKLKRIMRHYLNKTKSVRQKRQRDTEEGDTCTALHLPWSVIPFSPLVTGRVCGCGYELVK